MMKILDIPRHATFTAALVLAALAGQATGQSPSSHERGSFVVANRGSGDITVLAAKDGKVLQTVALPKKNDLAGEPMYISSTAREVLVGDRKHDRVVRFDKRSYRVVGEYAVGKGVFHQWSDGQQLWVNNDVDKTTSVIDLRRHRVIKTIAMPEDLVKDGYSNHDVFVAHGFAWVSLLKPNADGYVVLYSARSFQPLKRAKVGGDPHLWLDRWTHTLVVPAQGGNRTDFLNPLTLEKTASLDLPGSHGVYAPLLSTALYVTNLPGAGKADLYNLRLIGQRQPKLVSTADTGTAVAHNIATNPWGTRIFVTHSGPTSRSVSIHAPEGPFWAPTGTKLLTTVKAGVNPFGIAYVR